MVDAVPMSPADALWLRELIRRESAIVLDESKQYLLDTRLSPLVRSEGFGSVKELVARARAGDRKILGLVVQAMTTNETSWFRDSGPFDGLKRFILPALARARAQQRGLRIWSAACSSGQEAYSVAMICREVLPPGFRVDIVGTDLAPAMVDKATQGRYSQLEVNRGLPASLLVRWMRRSGSGWQVSPELQQMVRFRVANLAAPWPADLGRFDIVLLRNVLIYFDSATKVDILRRARPVTREDGFLVLGAAETALGLDVGWVREQVGATSVLRPPGALALGAAAASPWVPSARVPSPLVPSPLRPAIRPPTTTIPRQPTAPLAYPIAPLRSLPPTTRFVGGR